MIRCGPARVKALRQYKIKEVSCGEVHTIASSKEGCLFTWGEDGTTVEEKKGSGQVYIIIT